MQNLKPTHLSPVADGPLCTPDAGVPADEQRHSSAISNVLDRVVAIAPAPLLPGEKRADYDEVALRIVRPAQPRDGIEEFLVRDVVDLTSEILRLRRLKAGLLRASIGSGISEVMDSLGYDESGQYTVRRRSRTRRQLGCRRKKREKGSRYRVGKSAINN
jgi:hypothetical protein